MEANQIQHLERLLDEYRKLVSLSDKETSKDSGDSETLKKLNEEKTQLTRQVQQLTKNIESLKTQLEIAHSKVNIRFYYYHLLVLFDLLSFSSMSDLLILVIITWAVIFYPKTQPFGPKKPKF